MAGYAPVGGSHKAFGGPEFEGPIRPLHARAGCTVNLLAVPENGGDALTAASRDYLLERVAPPPFHH